MGNAKSLRGGTLLMTPLKGADGQVYAIAQGNMLVGRRRRVRQRLQGADQPAGTAGASLNGAVVERAVAALQRRRRLA